jgi:uncharacterized membrane protein
MFNRPAAWFGDVTRCCIFLIAYQSFLATGYGQDQSAQNLAPARLAPVSPLGSKPNTGNPFAAKPAVTSKLAPPAQAVDFRAVISVGRTLSALTVGAVTNNTLTITYSVFNLRGDPVSDVLLTTTLQSGVTFQSAVPTPDRSGQQLAFSLGSLPPLGTATAQVTVTLAGSSTTQIDNGATAFAYWNGYPEKSQALAASLRTGTINTALLGSSASIDANPTDPYISGQAAQLGNDPNRIFQFVRDQIGYESYLGALRGARGTLWSMAGDSLDKASLLVALLRASGIPAQYASGTLNQSQEQQLILSMFPAQTQLTGYVAAGATLSNPAGDPTLQSEAQPHYWVRFDNGTGTFVDADPDFAGAQIGQTFTANQGTFAEVADTLHHHVTVNLNIELYQQGLFGPSLSTSTPLSQTFPSVALVGHPLTLAHFVQTQSAGFVLSVTTNSYTPYLVVGQNGPNPSADPVITGQQYQEFITNFPFASQVLTGVFLEVDTADPAGNTTTSTHTIVDRIGYAVRNGYAAGNISIPPGGQPAITQFDNVSISVESGLTNPDLDAAMDQRDDQISAEAIPQIPQGVTPDPATLATFNSVVLNRMISTTQSTAADFTSNSQVKTAGLNTGTQVKGYFNTPRVFVASGAVQGSSGNVTFGIDLLKDNIRALAAPGQNSVVTQAYQATRGVAEGGVEYATMASLSPSSSAATSRTISMIDVLSAAKTQGVSMVTINASNIGQLAASNYSANAQALMTAAIQLGNSVVVPSQAVSVGGQNITGWYEVNPTTGAIVDTLENGGHQALTEWAFDQVVGIILFFEFGQLINLLPNSHLKSTFQCAFGQISLIAVDLAGLIGLFSFAIVGLSVVLLVILAAVFAYDFGETSEACEKFANGDAIKSGGPGIVSGGIAAAGAKATPSAVQPDPPVPGVLLSAAAPGAGPSSNLFSQLVQFSSTAPSGAVTGQVVAASLRATNQVAATWSSTAISSFQAAILTASSATVRNNGQTIGSGAVALSVTTPIAASISGAVNYSVNGTGDLSFYGPATSAIGASGNWTNYSATLTGSPSLQFATDALTLNGSPLPQGTYTVTASSIGLAGSGASTTPNFAGSASLTVTAGSVYVGPGSGTFTSGGTPLSPTNGITLDGFTGTLAVTGNGATDTVNISGSAASVLVVSPSPASFTTNQNTPVTFATQLTTSLADTYTLSAEAPAGWTVSMDANGNVTATPAPGLQSGTFPIFVTAASSADANLVAQAAVLITLGATAPGVTLNVATDGEFTVPVNGAQLPSAFRATIQNTGPAADTFNVTFTGGPAGFTALDSANSYVIPPGSVAVDGIYLSPTGALPAPGTQVSFTVTVTSATNSGITASQLVSFTVPAIQALTLSASPTALSTTPGTATMSTLTLQSVGNVAVTAALSSVTDPNLTLSGLSPSITLGVGQSSTQSLTITPGANAPLSEPLNVAITAAFGSSETASASLTVQVNAVQALAAVGAAASASALGRTDIAATLSGLSGAIDTAVSSCSPAAQAEVVAYVNNLIAEMNAPFLQNFVATFQADASAISSATCANIGAALTQLSADLANLSTVLQSPAAFPFNLALQPNSAVAEPASPTNFLIVLQNNSTTTNTYTLSLGSLPSGVNGSLSTSSVTLAPGAAIPVNGALNNPGVTITPSTSTAFQFSLNASINGVSGSTQTAYGTMTARSTFLAVQDVIATPGFTNSGGSVDVTTHIANVVNQNKTVQVTLVVNNSSSVQVLGPFTETVPLSVSTLLTTVDFGQINTTGLANGNYTLSVSVIDPLTNMVMPGGTGTGNLLIGSPVTATLAVAPQTLAPGNGTVTSTLSVSATASSDSGGSGTGSLIPIGSPLTFGGTNAPDTYTATTTFSSTPVLVDSGALTIWQQQVPTGPTGEWDIFYMQTTSGGPLANDINGYWNVVMNYQLSAAVDFDQVVNQWLVNGTPVSPLTNGIGSICCALATNPILPGEAYYANGFATPLPAGTQTDWQQAFVTPYSYITAGGIDPNTANEFIFALHFTRQSATGVQYTAAVQIANNANAAYNASSFSTAPTSITPGSGADTVTWVNPASNTITWTSNVTGIQPAQVLPIDLGGTINFTVTAGSGTVTLPQVDVNSGQILGLSPGTQTVAPGQLAAYTLTVNNPTSAPITYNLAVTGISQTWVALQSSVTVPATGSMSIPLNLRSTLADIAGTYSFMVLATSGGTSGSVEGTMILAGAGNIGAVGSSNNLGVLTTLTPTQATGGQGTPTTFTVQLTNTGNVADTYTLSATTPAGVTATFPQSSLQVPPGLSNFRQTLVQVTAAQGTTVGPQNFTITATSQTNTQIQGQATGTLNVVAMGVALSLSPASVNPGGTFQLTVRNLGSVQDTFTLALGGPAAVISSLAASSVTLAPGQSQQISIAVGAAPFATLGSLGLVVTATGGVTGTATATVVIPSSLGVSAAFNPTRTGLSVPGPATLLLQIQNTGTIQDSYIASIVSTSGPITASLVDITGQSVQTTSPFILPGTAQGELVVNATLTGTTDGTVTVKITSQTNAAITATAVGVLGIGNSVPVAIAGKNRNVPTGRYTSLDGGQSYDPDENRLTYAWTVLSKPAGSVLTTAGLGNASTPQPFFLADVNGAYTLQLIVNNGSVNSAPSTVQITAFTNLIPPNANAGAAANALRGSPVILNGTASNDPSQTGLALTYSWTVESAPAGSALAGSPIGGNTPTPSFTPDADGAFTIGLQVSDAAGSGVDTVTITAFNPSVPPNAVAGANRRILLNTPITVDGSASNDPGNSQALAYQWSFVSASLSSAALLNASGAQVAFAPAAPGFYVLRLDVSNGATTSFGETTVMAAKFCDANADGVINQADFDLMTALLGSAAQPNDPLDVNGDGLITSADILLCQGQGAPVGSPNLYVTPPYLVFQYTRGGPLPAAQALTISSDGITGFTIPNPSFSWITLNPQSGTTPGSVSVGINPAGLAAGPYLGQLLPVANGYNSPAPVRIELTVLDPPLFIITPGSLTFTYQSGGAAPPPQTVELQASGQNVNFSAAVSGATWLSVNPSSGMTPKPLVFTATPSPGMAPGTYTATVTFSASSSPSAPSAPSQSIVVTLIVTAAPPTVNASAIVNAASDIGGPVAPGEIIFVGGAGFAVAGTNLTPPSGPIPVELGSTQIFFDTTPAPLLLLQPGLLKAIVPYEVAGQTTTQMRVVYSGVPSQVLTLPVAVSNPGIFTTTTTGIGQILALNADSSLNGATNPAARGSVLTFYETGEGQTIPAGVDGAIASTIASTAGGKAPPVPAQKVSVTIGGQPAVVNYAGGAPGFPAGLMQVNVVIPDTAPTGAPIAVVITVGPNQSQTGATIWVN